MIGRIGGKRKLKNKILTYFPKDYQKMKYVEPFVGGGNIFFAKEPSIEEIINDKDIDVIEVFRGFKEYPIEKINKELNKLNKTKEDFDRIKNSQPTDKFKSFIRQYYLFKNSYFGLGKNFNDKKGNLFVKYDFHNRLKNVHIFNKDYKDLFKYDSPNTLFYLDPPYEHSEKLYKHDTVSIEELYHILSKIKGKFILSYNDSKKAKELFKDYHIFRLKTAYVDPVKGGSTRIKTELLILNF
jgi:DNA adenine methylase